jgi:hypothetical protein
MNSGRVHSFFDKFILTLENRFGRYISAAIIGALFMMVAAIYVRPAVSCSALGVLYSRMSDNPFVVIPKNAVGFRILTPLISYLVGLRGDLIIVTTLILATVLIAVVYHYYRVRSPQPTDALIAAAVMTFSLVTLSTIFYGGYCDSMTYLLVFLMWRYRSRRIIFYVLFFLGLLNHESVGFLMPWFGYLAVKESFRKSRGFLDVLIGFIIVFGLFYLYREWMASRGEIIFTAKYYLKPILLNPLHWFIHAYPRQGLGLFTVFKALWILPVAAAISLWKLGRRDEVYSMILILFCVGAQLLIAFDSSRMLTLSFPVMIISLNHLFETNAFQFRAWAGYVVILNLFVPQLYTASGTIEIMRSIPGNIFSFLFQGRAVW